jgi:GxxExxY protein
MSEILLKDEVYAIAGAAMEVYYVLGPGFSEPIYQEALEIELTRRNIPFESQKHLLMEYKGAVLQKPHYADLVCYDQVVIELKALDRLSSVEVSQLMNYMKITKMRVGLLINFGSRPKLEWKRYVI